MTTRTVVTLVELAGALLYCWWLYAEISKSDENLEAELWMFLARVFQRLALWFGSVGLSAELKYRAAVENGRMI